MIPTKADIEALHRHYAQSETLFTIVFEHCQIVTEIALWCVEQNSLDVDKSLLEAGCLLHDIGTYALYDAAGKGGNAHNYKQHAIFGAALVLEEGFDGRIADMIRTHVLLGLTKKEIIANNFALPKKDYTPTSMEGRLLCYADRFHSKQPTFNAFDPFLARLSKILPKQAEKFKLAAVEFGVPDIEKLAQKYGHPVGG